MRRISLYLSLLLGLTLSSATAQTETDLDSNVAFYEGESFNYVIYPPDGFRMVTDEAAYDGYSFAFVPEPSTYDSSDIMIGVNIFKIRGLDFNDMVKQDTASIREHYGANMLIRPVDSVFSGSGDILPTFYIDNREIFIPNVMISYYNGKTEVLIFELVISEGTTRFKAEDLFIACLKEFKAMPVGELGYE